MLSVENAVAVVASKLGRALRDDHPQSLELIRELVQSCPAVLDESLDWDSLERPLHVACQYGASVSVLKFLVETSPAQVFAADCDGRLALHRLCEFGGLAEISYLVQHSPETLKVADHRQYYPLHLACLYQSSLDVIRLLVEAFPDAVQRLTHDGNTPLALACQREENSRVISFLCETWPEAAEIPAENGDLPLHWVLRQEQPSLPCIQSLVQAYPESLQINNHNGELPLQIALPGRRRSILHYLIEQWPDAVCWSLPWNRHGDTPLHWVCRHGLAASVQVLQHFQTDMKTANLDGELPLHLACEANESIDKIRYLLKSYPQAAQATNFLGETPLEIMFGSSLRLGITFDRIVKRKEYRERWDKIVTFLWFSYTGSVDNAPSMVSLVESKQTDLRKEFDWTVHAAASVSLCPEHLLDFLCSLFPEQALVYDENGLTPLLHAVCSSDPAVGTETATQVLLHWNSEAARRKDLTDLRLPLCHALQNGRSFLTIQKLIDAYPEALQERDSTGLFPFELAAVYSLDLDSLYAIIRHWPELICRVSFVTSP